MKGALLLSLAAFGCTPDFDDEALVKDLRVLGLSADTPEVLFEGGPLSMQTNLCPTAETIMALAAEVATHVPPTLPTVTLRPLVVDPRGGGRPVHYRAVACVSPSGTITDQGGGNNMPGGVRQTIGRGACPDVAPVLAEGDAAPPPGALTVPIEVPLSLTRELLLGALQADPLGLIYGLPITVQLTVSAGDEQVIARKRVLLATQLAPEQVPNHNPVITGLVYRKAERAPDNVIDLGDPTREPLLLHLGEKMLFEPKQGDKEMYPARVGDRHTGCVQIQSSTEALRFAFFATAGSFAPDTTNTEPPVFRGPGTMEHKLESSYQAPRALLPGESDLVRIWIVTRDERAGTSWMRFSARLVP